MMVACARLAASTMDVFTMSRLLRASGSQSNSSSSRCRPSACTLSLLPGLFSAEKIFGQNFVHCGAIFGALQEKSGPPVSSRWLRSGAGEGPPGAAAATFCLGGQLFACVPRPSRYDERNSRRVAGRERGEPCGGKGGRNGLDTSDQGGGHSRERRGRDSTQRLRQCPAGGGH